MDTGSAHRLTNRFINEVLKKEDDQLSRVRESVNRSGLSSSKKWKRFLNEFEALEGNISTYRAGAGTKEFLLLITLSYGNYNPTKEYDELLLGASIRCFDKKMRVGRDYLSFTVSHHCVQRIIERTDDIDESIDLKNLKMMIFSELQYVSTCASAWTKFNFDLAVLDLNEEQLGIDQANKRLSEISFFIPASSGLFLCEGNGQHLHVKTFYNYEMLSENYRAIRAELLNILPALSDTYAVFYPSSRKILKKKEVATTELLLKCFLSRIFKLIRRYPDEYLRRLSEVERTQLLTFIRLIRAQSGTTEDTYQSVLEAFISTYSEHSSSVALRQFEKMYVAARRS